MSHKKIFLYLFCLVYALPYSGWSQDFHSPLGIEKVAAGWIRNIRSLSTEKILLHTDKTIYTVNENIWFKAYIVDSINEKPKTLQGLLYVDLVDESNKPITQIFLRADQLQTSGSMFLSDSLNSGYYWLRAYTRFDPKTGQSNASIQPVLFMNPKFPLADRTSKPSPKASGSSWSADIFPEGGALMSGSDNVVLVRLHDGNGQPITDSGSIKDKQGRSVVNFHTNQDGYAKILFSPSPKGKYALFVKKATGYDSIAPMPPVNMHGAQISILEHSSETLKARVMLEDSLFSPNFSTYLLAVHEDSLCFASVGQGMYEVFLPVPSFPSGTIQLLLFDDRGKLLSQRKVFIPGHEPQVSITPDKQEYGSREPVHVQLALKGNAQQPLQAILSVSVTDARLTEGTGKFFVDSLSIDSLTKTDMYLISRVELPAESNPKGKLTSDYQLLFNPFLYEGNLLNKKDEPLTNYEISLLSTKKGFTLMQDTSNASGHFRINVLPFSDTVDYDVKVKNLKGKVDEYHIERDPSNFPKVYTPLPLRQDWVPIQEKTMGKVKAYQLDTLFQYLGKGALPAVTVRSAKKKNSEEGRDDPTIITREKLQALGSNSIGNALLSVPGVHLSSGFVLIGGLVSFHPSVGDEPILMIDGSQSNLDAYAGDPLEPSPLMAALKTMNIRDIEYIHVLTGPEAAQYGMRGGHGVVEVHTTSKAFVLTPVDDSRKVRMIGFASPKTFVGKEYGAKSAQDQKFPDRRTTLFWGTDLITDKEGKINLHFYTGDTQTDYLITVAGLTASGEKIYNTLMVKM